MTITKKVRTTHLVVCDECNCYVELDHKTEARARAWMSALGWMFKGSGPLTYVRCAQCIEGVGCQECDHENTVTVPSLTIEKDGYIYHVEECEECRHREAVVDGPAPLRDMDVSQNAAEAAHPWWRDSFCPVCSSTDFEVLPSLKGRGKHYCKCNNCGTPWHRP